MGVARIIGSILCVFAMTGCAVASEIVPMGKDSYMVMSPETIGGHGRIIVLEAANKYCASQNTHMIVRTIDANAMTVSLTFSCVYDNDPEYQRPNLKKDPNIVIENRR
jgi:hypothetical protein